MIVVDSSVWIDHFNAVDSPEERALRDLIATEEPVGIVDLCLTEILRGFRSEKDANLAMGFLISFPQLEVSGPGDHIQAAALYRRARKSGVTVKGSVDLLVASLCIQHEARLLHKDRDFDQLATVSDLKVWKPTG